METTKDYTTLTQLKTDLEDKLNRLNDYDTEPQEVKVGEYLWEDMKSKPAIGISSPYNEVEKEIFGNTYVKRVYITVDLFMDNQPGLQVFEDIYKFKDDVETFIFKTTDWTYQNESHYIEPSIVYIGGSHDPVKQATVVFYVRYKD